MTEPLRFEYDEATDIITIEGCMYSARLFRELGPEGMKTGQLFRLLNRDEDGAIIIQTVEEGEYAGRRRED